ncbi:MAG: hypothetical protein JWN46_1304 [Acidimicrobiales bacterium]|nr:hypothetical protein [Acidimicrobiales bacterium]
MTPRRHRVPPARRLRNLSTRAFVVSVLALLVLIVLLVAVVNPGHRNGPVRPAVPPVGLVRS